MTAARPRLVSRIYDMGQPAVDPDPIATWGRIERLRRSAWRMGIIAVPVAELPDELRRAVEEWATGQYGSRNG